MGGLETLPDATRIARLVRSATGADARGLRPLGAGESTMAWRVETDGEPLVVLHERPGVEWPSHLAMQSAVLEALVNAEEARAPRAIASSADPELEGIAALGLEWAIVSEAAGAPVDEGALSSTAARDLGVALATLHDVPTEGFGRLENQRDALRGESPDMRAGLLSRWPELWPYDGSALIGRPIARAAARLVVAIAPLEPALQRFATLPRGVLLHGDLNPEHVWVNAESALASVIDFGDAFVGPPAADVATFAYFFGWDRATDLLEGYTGEPLLRELRLEEARLFAVVYAIHRINRAAQRGAPGGDDRHTTRAIAFLEETLPALAYATRES